MRAPLPDAASRNVVAEVIGRERPDEVVVLGGISTPGTSGREPWMMAEARWPRGRRSGSSTGWAFGPGGPYGWCSGPTRRTAARVRWPTATPMRPAGKHVLAMESDNGAFTPHGFRFSGSDAALAQVQQVAALASADRGRQRAAREKESPEADIAPLVERGVPGIGLDVDRTRYFWFHHSEGDTLDKLDPAELARCVAAMAVMAYVVADLPDALARTATR